MPPVGLIALAAVGLVLIYAIPDRIRETGRYVVLQTESRYRADLQVVRASASRIRQTATEAPRKRAKALAPREAKASIKALGGTTMSRPAAPLDRAATVAQRQMISLRRDVDRVQARRAAQARRRAVLGVLSLLVASVAWFFVVTSAWPLWPAIAASTAFGGIAVAGRRAVRAQRKTDARLDPVAREVAVAATATAALQRIAVERASGHQARPSDAETQAIEVVTTLAAAPAEVLLDAPPVAFRPDLKAPFRPDLKAPLRPDVVLLGEDEGWTVGVVPRPRYTLEPPAKPRTPRPISEEDLQAGERAAKRAALEREVALAPELPAVEAEASTQTLEDILQRRRFRSA